MKFSIIVPVWNTEKYLRKCLTSILNQTYENYEVIIINDGSPDNSNQIIDEFVKNDNRFIDYSKENTGLSDTRNFGVKKATGDYLLFLDSDDYYNSELLEKLNKCSKDNDIIKFGCTLVNNNYNLIKTYKKTIFENINDVEALKILVTDELLDSTCIYAFKTSFYKKNKFEFLKNCRYEDFGLIPFVLLKAKTITSIEYNGYNYVKLENSFINDKSYLKEKNKFIDFVKQYQLLMKNINNSKEVQEKIDILNIYIVDCMVRKYNSLNLKLKKEFKKIYNNEKIYKILPSNSLKRKVKKYVLAINYKIYLMITNLKRK